MIAKLISRLFWVPLGIIMVLFLVANRQPVAISLDPTSADNPAIQSFPLPLWVWLIGFLLLGFFLGTLGAWISGRDQRLQALADRKSLKALQKENQILAAQSTREAPLIVAEG